MKMKYTMLLLLIGVAIHSAKAQKAPMQYWSNTSLPKAMLIEQDRVWLATNGGILELDKNGKQLQKYTIFDGLLNENVWNIIRDEQGQLLAQSEGGIVVLKQSKWERYQPTKIPEESRLVLQQNTTHTKVLGYTYFEEDSSTLILDDRTYRFADWKTGSELLSNQNYPLPLLDKTGRRWVLGKEGVLHLSQKGNSFELYPIEKTNGLKGLYKDKDGTIWVYSESGKIWYHYRKYNYQFVKSEGRGYGGLKEWQKKVVFVDNNEHLWTITENKDTMYCYKGDDKWETVPLPVGPYDAEVDFFDRINLGTQAADGRYWFATELGNLYEYNGTNWRYIVVEKPEKEHTPIRYGSFLGIDLFVDKDDNTWYSCVGKLVQFDPVGHVKATYVKQNMTSKGRFTHLYLSNLQQSEDGTIWAIDGQEGVYRVNTQKQQIELVYLSVMAKRGKAVRYFAANNNDWEILVSDATLIRKQADGTIRNYYLSGKLHTQSIRLGDVFVQKNGTQWITTDSATYKMTPEGNIEQTYYAGLTKSFIGFGSIMGARYGFRERQVLFEDQKENVWSRSLKGIDYWQTATNQKTSFSGYPTEGLGVQIKGLNLIATIDMPTMLEDQQGNILITSMKEGVLKWDGKRWTGQLNWKLAKRSSIINGLFEDSKKALWLINLDGGVDRCQGNQCETIVPPNGTNVIKIVENQTGIIYLLLQTGSLIRYQLPK